MNTESKLDFSFQKEADMHTLYDNISSDNSLEADCSFECISDIETDMMITGMSRLNKKGIPADIMDLAELFTNSLFQNCVKKIDDLNPEKKKLKNNFKQKETYNANADSKNNTKSTNFLSTGMTFNDMNNELRNSKRSVKSVKFLEDEEHHNPIEVGAPEILYIKSSRHAKKTQNVSKSPKIIKINKFNKTKIESLKVTPDVLPPLMTIRPKSSKMNV